MTLIRRPKDPNAERENRNEMAKRLKADGRSLREIASIMGVTLVRARKYLSYKQRSKLLDEEKRRIVLEMREAGATWREIGTKLGISRQRAHQLGKDE